MSILRHIRLPGFRERQAQRITNELVRSLVVEQSMILSERLELIGPLDEGHRRNLVAIIDAQKRYEQALTESDAAAEHAASELAEARRRAIGDGWTTSELTVIGITEP